MILAERETIHEEAKQLDTLSDNGTIFSPKDEHTDVVKKEPKVTSGLGERTYGHTKRRDIISLEREKHQRAEKIREIDMAIVIFSAFEQHGIIEHAAPEDRRPELQEIRRELSSINTQARAVLREVKTFDIPKEQ